MRQARRNRRRIPWIEWRDDVAYAHWYDPDSGRVLRRSLGTRDAGEAQARFAAFLAEGGPQRAASQGTGGPARVTVSDVLDAYELGHVRPNVVDKDRAADVIANLRAFFGPMRPQDITVADGRKYVDKRGLGLIGGLGRGGKAPMAGGPATCRRELAMLIAAINHGITHGHLSADGFRRDLRGRVVLVELPPDSEPVTRWLHRPAEMAALRAACGETGRLRWFLEIAYYTASRRDAIETLTRFQVDMERGRINLAKPGEKRTTKRRPIVPIDPALRPWLAAALEKSPNEWVLGSPQPVYRDFMRAVERAGLGADVTPHVLRHSRATHMLQDGIKPWAVANLLGDSVATLVKTYGSHCPDYMAEVLGEEAKDG